MVAALALVCVMPGWARSEMRPGAVSVSPMVGGYLFEGNQDLKDNNLTLGIGLGYNFTENFAVESTFNWIDTKSTVGRGDVDGYLYKVDGLFNYPVTPELVPYLAVGAGGITLDPEHGGSDSSFLVNYGGGIRYFLTDDLAIRGDVRHVISFSDVESNLMYTFGLTYFFGGEKAEAAPPPAPEPMDTDGDGVYDDRDRCPDTPRGVKVDSDGCPLDTDGDGVPDYKDECPDTPKGAKVDEKGCPEQLTKEICIILNIEFDFDKADIKPQYHDDIKKVADCMTEYPDTTAVIEGHTDNKGDEAYNLKLSQMRAEAVMQYLIDEFGVAPERLTAKGFGESQPIADNSTEEGRQKNRRVYARINATVKK